MALVPAYGPRSFATALAAYGARTAFNYGVRQGVNSIGNFAYNTVRRGYNNYSMQPRYSRKRRRPTRGPGPKRRRVTRRANRGRRIKRNRRGRFPAGKGPYQKRFPGLFGRRLNTNFTRNDYDSTREVMSKNVMFPSSVSRAIQSFNISVLDLPIAASKLLDYDEYKYANIQMVLTPLNLANGAKELTMNDNSTPYLYYVKRIHPESNITDTTLETWKNTPGVQRVALLGRRPIVINFAVQAPMEDEIIANAAGAAFTIQRPMRRVGWMHNPQTVAPLVAANYPNFAAIDFCLPQLAIGTFQPKWRVEYYVTMYFKGNRTHQLVI